MAADEVKELVYEYRELIRLGVPVTDIKDLIKKGLIELGVGRLENGQIVKLVKVNAKGLAFMKSQDMNKNDK